MRVATAVADRPRSRAAFADLTPHEKLTRLQDVYPDQAAAIAALMDVAWRTQERERRSRQARASLPDRLAARGARE